jgi:hypothetical protein
MSTQLNSKLPCFTKVLLDIIFGLLIFSSIALALLIVFLPFILNGTKVPLTASVQVGIGSVEAQHFEAQISADTTKGIQKCVCRPVPGHPATGNLYLAAYFL